MYGEVEKWKIEAITLGTIDGILWASFHTTKEKRLAIHYMLVVQGCATLDAIFYILRCSKEGDQGNRVGNNRWSIMGVTPHYQ